MKIKINKIKFDPSQPAGRINNGEFSQNNPYGKIVFWSRNARLENDFYYSGSFELIEPENKKVAFLQPIKVEKLPFISNITVTASYILLEAVTGERFGCSPENSKNLPAEALPFFEQAIKEWKKQAEEYSLLVSSILEKMEKNSEHYSGKLYVLKGNKLSLSEDLLSFRNSNRLHIQTIKENYRLIYVNGKRILISKNAKFITIPPDKTLNPIHLFGWHIDNPTFLEDDNRVVERRVRHIKIYSTGLTRVEAEKSHFYKKGLHMNSNSLLSYAYGYMDSEEEGTPSPEYIYLSEQDELWLRSAKLKNKLKTKFQNYYKKFIIFDDEFQNSLYGCEEGCDDEKFKIAAIREWNWEERERWEISYEIIPVDELPEGKFYLLDVYGYVPVEFKYTECF